jgi:hypothetical protein
MAGKILAVPKSRPSASGISPACGPRATSTMASSLPRDREYVHRNRPRARRRATSRSR